MIFVSDFHGAGKSYFYEKVKFGLSIETYSASTLISERKHKPFSAEKIIPDIDTNHHYLLYAVDELLQV
jgi:adenylate kinase